MGNENMKGVRDAYKELIQKGYENIEIFDEVALKGNWLNDLNIAQQEMKALSSHLGRYLK